MSGIAKGLGIAVATYLGEGAINDVFRAVGARPRDISMGENARALWRNLIGGEDVSDVYAPKQDTAPSLIGTLKAIQGWLERNTPRDLTRPIGELGPAIVPQYEPPRTRGGVSDVRPMPSGPVKDPLEALRSAIIQTRQVGTSEVHLTNPPPRPNVTVNAPITIHEATDAAAVASMINARIGQTVKSAAESVYSDGAM